MLQAAWDEDALYFALRVTDDAIVTDSPGVPWQDDAVELGLDGRHDHARRWDLPELDDRQFTVDAAGHTFESGAPVSGLTVGHARTADGYVLEIAIPKANLGPLPLTAGQVAGFNFGLIDDDSGGDAETRLYWLGQGTYAANSTWGQLRLSALPAGFGPPPPTSTPQPTPTPWPTATPTATPPPGAVTLRLPISTAADDESGCGRPLI